MGKKDQVICVEIYKIYYTIHQNQNLHGQKRFVKFFFEKLNAVIKIYSDFISQTLLIYFGSFLFHFTSFAKAKQIRPKVM